MSVELRQARPGDYEAVAAFTRDTWPDRELPDYIPDVYHEWMASEGPTQRTFVLDSGDDIAGVAQGAMLSEYEAWAQAMRINPDFRGSGHARRLTRAIFSWAHDRGATVCRNMIFSWNAPSLGLSRAAGFDPCTEFRHVHPTPDADADPDHTVVADADAAWAFWTESRAREALRGLAFDEGETWAMSELTREKLRTAADDGRLFVVREGGTRAFAHRIRTFEREADDGPVRWAEYGVGAWKPGDVDALSSLFDAVARDAAAQGAARARVPVPEGCRWVTDAAATRVGVADEPDFVLSADLTDPSLRE